MILNIYKEANWTSFDVVAKLRGILKTKKIGHAGTLDPLAEGVLVVLTGDDTKKQDSVMGHDKEYEAEFGLGISSPTLDLEFTPDFVENLPEKQDILNTIQTLTGTYEQEIPIYSAKKVAGKELYKYARQGKSENIPVQKKEVTIHTIEVLGLDNKVIPTSQGDKEIPVLSCRITCSSGTYIRAIAHDLGLKLGTDGVLLKLFRTKVGDYSVNDSVKLSFVEERLRQR